MRHARFTLQDKALDELHALKRRLARERQVRVTIEDLLQEGVNMVLAHHREEENHVTQISPSLATRPST